jgi:drug/metabolite transporter (DMT)-like permease
MPAAGWMLLSGLLFASMGVCVKLASPHFGALELVFYRGLIGVLFVLALARRQGVPLATRHPRMHAWRSTVGVASLAAWFYAIAHLPLATAVTLNYMSSIWMAVFLIAGALAAWRPSPEAPRPPLQVPMLLSVAAGFAGVLMLLRPTIDPAQAFAGLVGLLSGMAAALAYMQVQALSRMGEPEVRTVFYFGLGSAVVGAAGMAFTGASPWTWPHALWLLPMGLLAAGGQLCLTMAYARTATPRDTLTLASLQYCGIIYASIFGLALFGDRIPAIGWAGMATIVASGIAASVLRSRGPDAAPPDARQETL